MSEWKFINLFNAGVDFIDGDRGKNYPSQDDFYTKGFCLFLNTKNVRKNGFDFSENLFISQEKDEQLRKGKLVRGDIVLTTRGTIGNTALYDDSVIFENIRINSGMVIIRTEDRIFSKFLLYFFKNLDFSSFISGSAQPQLPIRDLKQIEINLPPLPEQKAIADVLSALDDKIDLLHRQNHTLEQMAETLFRQWFVEEAQEDWEEDTFLKWITETKGGDWGKEHLTDEYSQAIRCLRGTDIADLQKGLPNSTPLRFIKPKKFQSIQPENGDIIFEISGGTETQSTGRCYYINDDVEKLFNQPLAFSNFCRLLKIKDSKYSFFVYLYLLFLYKNDEFFALENGSSGIKNLNYKSLLTEQTYKMPPEKLVIEFHQMVEKFFKKINKNKKQIQTLETLRDTLLPKLISGEVRVNVQAA